MLKSEFEKIQQPTWIKIVSPDDPFVNRVYAIISNVKKRIILTGRGDYEAYVHFYSEYTRPGFAGSGWRTLIEKKYSYSLCSDWNINHMDKIKTLPYKIKHGFFEGVFNPRDYK